VHQVVSLCHDRSNLDGLNYVSFKVTLRPTVSRSVCLSGCQASRPKTRFLLPSDSLMWGALSGERTFYCLRFETPTTRRARSPYIYPLGTGWPSYAPRHRVPFSSPPTTRRATVEVFEPASTQWTLKVTPEHKMCVYVRNISRSDKHFRRDARALPVRVNCPLLLSDFNRNWNVPINFTSDFI
jgi:hypothetical protein